MANHRIVWMCIIGDSHNISFQDRTGDGEFVKNIETGQYEVVPYKPYFLMEIEEEESDRK